MQCNEIRGKLDENPDFTSFHRGFYIKWQLLAFFCSLLRYSQTATPDSCNSSDSTKGVVGEVQYKRLVSTLTSQLNIYKVFVAEVPRAVVNGRFLFGKLRLGLSDASPRSNALQNGTMISRQTSVNP